MLIAPMIIRLVTVTTNYNLTTATTTSTPQINDLFGWMRKTRAIRLLVQSFGEVCQTTTWNFHIDNSSRQASESTLCRVCTTWPTWNNCITLNPSQSSILTWRLRFSSIRHSSHINRHAFRVTTVAQTSTKRKTIPAVCRRRQFYENHCFRLIGEKSDKKHFKTGMYWNKLLWIADKKRSSVVFLKLLCMWSKDLKQTLVDSWCLTF